MSDHIEFKVAPHTDPTRGDIVEVWFQGKFLAGIYPGAVLANGTMPTFRVITKHRTITDTTDGLVVGVEV